jgi:hypothetical protein
LEAARQKTEEALKSGTALLCAAGAKDVAKVPAGAGHTMFSGVMLDILRSGAPDLPERFSLADLGLRVQDLISERFSDEGVRPQVLSPEQASGDVAALPLFPNRRLDSKRLQQALTEMEARVEALLSQNQEQIAKREELEEKLRDLSARIDSPAAAAAPAHTSSLGEHRRFGLTSAQWDTLPGRIKSEIYAYAARRQAGWLWMSICVVLVSVYWIISILGLVLSEAGYSPYIVILMAVCLLFGGMSALSLLLPRWYPIAVHRSIESGPWDNFDAVVRARMSRSVRILSLEFDAKAVSFAALLYLGSSLVLILLQYVVIQSLG